MPERGCVRSGVARRVRQALQAAPVRPPGICGASKAETSNEDQRLHEKCKHRIRPVIAPGTFSQRSCDNMIIPKAENFATCGNICAATPSHKYSAQANRRHHARFAHSNTTRLTEESRGQWRLAQPSSATRPFRASRRWTFNHATRSAEPWDHQRCRAGSGP